MNFSTNPIYFESRAELLKAIAHPVRLCIVKGLLEVGESNVSNMKNCLDMPQSTISQHISKLKSAGIISGQRNGLEIMYSICNEDVKEVIKILFKELNI